MPRPKLGLLKLLGKDLKARVSPDVRAPLRQSRINFDGAQVEKLGEELTGRPRRPITYVDLRLNTTTARPAGTKIADLRSRESTKRVVASESLL